MIYFPDTYLKRFTLTGDKMGVYGEQIKTYVYEDTVHVDFQNENNVEIAHNYGVDLQNLYKIYAPLELNLNDTDKYQDDKGNSYHVIGNIQKYPKFHKYQKLHIVRER